MTKWYIVVVAMNAMLYETFQTSKKYIYTHIHIDCVTRAENEREESERGTRVDRPEPELEGSRVSDSTQSKVKSYAAPLDGGGDKKSGT